MINKVMKDDVMHDINDKRIPTIAVADVGKFLSVDENGMSFKDVVDFDGELYVTHPSYYYAIEASNMPNKSGVYKLIERNTNEIIGYGYISYAKIGADHRYTGLISFQSKIYKFDKSSSSLNISFDFTNDNLMPTGTQLYKHAIGCNIGGPSLTVVIYNTTKTPYVDSDLFNSDNLITGIIGTEVIYINSGIYIACVNKVTNQQTGHQTWSLVVKRLDEDRLVTIQGMYQDTVTEL